MRKAVLFGGRRPADPWRTALAVVAVAISLAAQVRAAECPAPPEYLLRYLSTVSVQPSVPNILEPTTMSLRGWFPYPCGHVSSASVVDGQHLELTLSSGSGCADTTCQWSQSFALGYLPAGPHGYDLALTAQTTDSGSVVRHITLGFTVADTTHPAPQPMNYPPGFLPHVVNWSVEPAIPNVHESTQVDLLGWVPYFCGGMTAAQVVDSGQIELTLGQGTACADTAQMWRRGFDLGVLPLGPHPVTVRVTLTQPDSADKVETGSFSFDVAESGTPPPPPPPPGPPQDSLLTVLSHSRPNPFAQETRFSVSLEQPTQAEIAVFDLGGRRVIRLFQGLLPRGTSQMAWNGKRGDGSAARSGIYFYRLTLPSRVVTRRVVLLGQP